jgi:hypothetical protein
VLPCCLGLATTGWCQTPRPESQTRSPVAKSGTVQFRVKVFLNGVNQHLHLEQSFWTKTLTERSNGSVQAEVVPFDCAGIRASESLRLLQLGVLPFGRALLGRIAAVEPELSASDLAGLNHDIAPVLRAGNAFLPVLERTLKQNYGVELLAVCAYPAQVICRQNSFGERSDLKGRKVRTASSSQAKLIEALGVDAERETQVGITCNTGQPSSGCSAPQRGKMMPIRLTAQGEQLRRDVLLSTVLTRWIQRCGALCAHAWEQSLGPVTGINPKTI